MPVFHAVTNANGILVDPQAGPNLQWFCADIDTLFVYAFGWDTDFSTGCTDYNRFAAGLVPRLKPMGNALLAPIFWPSVLSENPGSLVNATLNELTFYADEARADAVGANAGYAILAAAMRAAKKPLRIVLLGHSFGCKVVCSALQKLAISDENIPAGTEIRAVLLQAAFQSNAFDPWQQYCSVSILPVDLFASTSPLDRALGVAFPAAQAANILCPDQDRLALGWAGPTEATAAAWLSGFIVQPIDGWQHAAGLMNDPLSGEHSNIFKLPQLYDAVASFIQS